MPVILSATSEGTKAGAPVASPTTSARPEAAWMISSKAGRARCGPSWPKPVATAKTIRGFSALHCSGPKPRRAMPAGRILVTSTSAVGISRRSTSAPSGVFRSMQMLRLLRLMPRKTEAIPRLRNRPEFRTRSPVGVSILMISAPQSPICCVQKGPSTTEVRSSTRRPASGPVAAAVSGMDATLRFAVSLALAPRLGYPGGSRGGRPCTAAACCSPPARSPPAPPSRRRIGRRGASPSSCPSPLAARRTSSPAR